MSDAPSSRSTSPLPTPIARLVVPALLVILVVLQARGATADNGPGWLTALAAAAGISGAVVVRLLIMIELLLAGTILLVRPMSRGAAIGALGAIAFSEIADLSAGHGVSGFTGSLAMPGWVVLGVAAALLAALLLPGRPPSAARFGHWHVAGLALALTVALVVGGRVTVAPAPPAPGGPAAPSGTVVEFAFDSWIGAGLSGTPLARELPEIVAMTMEGDCLIVFYNPACGRCHDLFDLYFLERDLPVRVIAVRVPPAEGAVVLESDQPDEITCPDCELLELPTGPLWLITPPATVALRDGKVVCVGEHYYETCVQEMLGDPAP